MQQRFFIADLIACSTRFGHHYAHHQELKSIIQWLLPVVFKLLVWCVAEGYVSGLQDAAAVCFRNQLCHTAAQLNLNLHTVNKLTQCTYRTA